MFVNAALLIATDCSYKGLKDGVDDKKTASFWCHPQKRKKPNIPSTSSPPCLPTPGKLGPGGFPVV